MSSINCRSFCFVLISAIADKNESESESNRKLFMIRAHSSKYFVLQCSVNEMNNKFDA